MMGRLVLHVNLHDDTVDPLLAAVAANPDQATALIADPDYIHAAAYIVQRVADAQQAVDAQYSDLSASRGRT